MPRPRLLPTIAAALLGAALGAGGLAALADPPRGGFAPDPPALASRKQWVFELTSRGGKVSVDAVKAGMLAQPAESPRVLGRFALELHIGRELLDRVRFNVPLMGDELGQGNKNRLHRPRFEEGVSARITVRMADNPRAAYLLLVDRQTGDTQKFEWPPEKDGRVLPWKTGLSDASPGDFPEGGVRVTADAGAADAGKPSDAGRD